MKIHTLVLFLFILASCTHPPGELVAPQIDNSIQAKDISVSLTADNIPADNYSTAEISIQIINTSLIQPGTTVTFSADKGSFANGNTTYTIAAGTDGMSKAYLKYNQAGIVNVTASVNNSFTKTFPVTFVPAPPDLITLEPDIATLTSPPSAKANLTATLSRTLGTPTQNQALTFYDSTATGKSVGIFLNSTLSNASSQATSEYVLQDTTFIGYVYIKAYVTFGGKKITGTTRLLIKQ
jgi:hypothetical protein